MAAVARAGLQHPALRLSPSPRSRILHGSAAQSASGKRLICFPRASRICRPSPWLVVRATDERVQSKESPKEEFAAGVSSAISAGAPSSKIPSSTSASSEATKPPTASSDSAAAASSSLPDAEGTEVSSKGKPSPLETDGALKEAATGASSAASASPSSSSGNTPSSVSASPEAIEPASASGDSVAAEVASLPDAEDTEGVAPPKRKPSPLERGGTLQGASAAGKDPSKATLAGAAPAAAAGDKFSDPRWKKGTWDFSAFTEGGKVNWDSVIDAEVARRKWLEENPESSTNEDPVLFETSQVPWWAWVRRFHLPEAEKLNGRAAMVGYAMGYLVDSATGVGLVDQQGSFLGKLLILVTVAAVLLIRRNADVVNLKNLADEWTFYDKQWQATWKEGKRPSESEKEK